MMEGPDERIHYLVDRFFNNTCTQAEKVELSYWIEKSQNDSKLKQHLSKIWSRFEPFEDMSEEKANHLFNTILNTDTSTVLHLRPIRRRMLFYAVAAASVLIIVIGSYFLYFQSSQHNISPAIARKLPNTTITNDVAPGQFKAVLTLSNGSQIILDTAQNQIVAKEDGSEIGNTSGQLFYNSSPNNGDEVVYHILTTSKGGQYSLTLSDGTKVRLNAASSVRFPIAFPDNQRDVEITGEVYFEVAPNKEKPFRVKARKGVIEVLGTHFNVNAYDDEPVIRTTLLEGAVKVRLGTSSALLKPNEQAVVKDDNNKISVYPTDGQAAIAWNRGYFKLTNSTVPDIMRQIARWYDIEIKYEGAIPSGTISGEVPRSLNLSEVLNVLDLSGVHSKLEGKTLIVFE